MKTITIDDELYAHIAAQTKYIGESASDILRRLLLPENGSVQSVETVTPSPLADKDKAFSINKADILACSTVVERFLLLLSDLANACHDFSVVLAIKGKGRDYFASSKEHLLATGSSTNPKPIPNTQFWVVTNNNTAKKAAILGQVAAKLGYSETVQNEIKQALTLK